MANTSWHDTALADIYKPSLAEREPHPVAPMSPQPAEPTTLTLRGFDAQRAATELEAEEPSVRAAIEALEQAKKVSPELLNKRIGQPAEPTGTKNGATCRCGHPPTWHNAGYGRCMWIVPNCDCENYDVASHPAEPETAKNAKPCCQWSGTPKCDHPVSRAEPERETTR